MKVYYSSKDFSNSIKKPIIALGNFDGVHLAHQKMFQLAKKAARKIKGSATAYTFYPHPVAVLAKDSAPLLINTLEQRLELLKKCGLNAVVVEPFDQKFAHYQAEQWFQKILLNNLHAAGVVAGYDFTFGTHRSGTVETLEILCTKHGLSCHILEAQMLGETLISSSQIRAFVSHGDMERAKALLGRYFFVAGQVIRGAGRGASIGIPTANLKVENELIPMAGVYACWVEYGKNRYKAVTNIGMNPTFGGNTLSVETHLLRFKGEIYGRKLRLHFVKKIREERTFVSSEELVKQIKKDIDTAKRIL